MTHRKHWLILTFGILVAAFALACTDSEAHDDVSHDATATGTIPVATETVAFVMDSATVLHHWQALSAMTAGDIDDARHHIEHIIGVVGDDAMHVEAMNHALTALNAGELHEAEHEIEEMLAGRAEQQLTGELMHLQMAVAAIDDGDAAEATHHLQHFTALVHETAEADEVVEFLEAGDLVEAAEHLAILVVSLSGDRDAHGDDGHDDADNTHDDADDADVRTVTITMTEFEYSQPVIEAKVGERVRIVVENDGAVLHDLSADEFHGDVMTEGSVEHHADDDHGMAAFHVAANAGDHAELTFVAEEAGELALYCTVPGHRELGMTATLVITAD